MTNSPYLLWILTRLYTSVIVLNAEKYGPEVSWSTDMSPTTYFSLGYDPCGSVASQALPVGVAGGCTRGGAGLGTGRVLYRVLPSPSQIPVFSHILRLRPYPRPYDWRIKVIDEVS